MSDQIKLLEDIKKTNQNYKINLESLDKLPNALMEKYVSYGF